jgi:cytochrome c-type biogenesis protein CcmE
MSSRLRIVLVSLVIVGAISYLVLTGVKQTGLQYMTVTELARIQRPPASGGFRLDGAVAVGSIVYNQKTPQLAFQMQDKNGSDVIGVVYDGLMPDAFGEGREVVVEGTYDHARRTLHASKLVTKCPSKYEAEGLGKDKT